MNKTRHRTMKTTLLLLTFVILSILQGGAQSSATDEFNKIDRLNEEALFQHLNRAMTLGEAIAKYPAILDYFPFEKTMPENMANVPVYDISNENAYDILIRVNARKNSSTDPKG